MLLSVVTVSYNSEKTIRKTIESLLAQTFSDFEYFIIDGNSTDNTIQIVKEYEEAFEKKGVKFTWISEEDGGIYDAMNKGVNLCKGTHIGLLNSDDWYENHTLELVAECCKNTQADYIHGNINTFSSTYKFLKTKKPESKEKMIQRMTFFHPASFISTKIYNELGRYSLEFPICADYDFILRIINRDYKIEYIDHILTNFLFGGLSTSSVVSALKESHLVRVHNGYNRFLSKLYYYQSYIICKYISRSL